MDNDKAVEPPLVRIDEIFILDGLERFESRERPPRAPANCKLLLRGWAAFVDAREPWHSLGLDVDSTSVDTNVRRESRRDVADHFASEHLLQAGFKMLIDLAAAGIGRHALKVLVDGVVAEPAFIVDVETSRPSRLPSVRDDRTTFRIAEFHRRLGETERPFRVYCGVPAVVRGWIADEQIGLPPKAVYIVVDGIDAYEGIVGVPVPGQSPPHDLAGNTPFLTCFRTTNLEAGSHVAELAIVRSDATALVWSQPIAFTIDPLEIGRAQVSPETHALAAISWIDEPVDVRVRSAAKRTFSRGEIALVRGWALERDIGAAAHEIFVVFENGEQFALGGHAPREDVALHYDMPNAVYCGFAGGIATATLRPGSNVGTCYVRSIDGRTVYASEAKIEIDLRD